MGEKKLRQTASISSKTKTTYALILIPIGIAINIVAGMIAGQLKLPFFMDSIGTVIMAVIMGPLVGGATGLLTNVVSGLLSGDVLSMAFGLANMSSGIIIGFMAKYKKFRTWLHLIIGAILITLSNSIIGAIVVVLLYGGVNGSGVDFVVAATLAAGQDIFSSAFIGRIPVNIVDKGIAIIIAFIILKRLPDNMKNLIPETKKKN
ncbi:ECF transporter S component [Virgibacillus sp. W0430]|uniref:ECF transporter S component n=1 Tax=Virgibacillus sp. W0430 TaxID=3391580 RepID=UPI003F46ED32